MRTPIALASIMILSFLFTSPAVQAGSDVVAYSDLDAAVTKQLLNEEQTRDRVRQVLAHPQIQELAGQLDVDLKRAASAVEVLDANELADIEDEIEELDRELSGGERVTISLVSLLLIIVIVLLIAD